MKRAPTRRLRDLLATTEAVRNDQRLRRRSPHRGEQDALADRLRHGERLGTEAERSGHSTAARIDRLERHAHLPEQRLFIGHLHERFVVTVADEERSEEHTSELQSLAYLVCRLLLEKKKSWPPMPRLITS